MKRGVFALLLLMASGVAAAAPVVDLSQRRVSITTGFAGGEVLLFGAVEEPADIVVVVRGPAADTVVRRKERVAGIWLNRDSVVFREAPGFYHLASTRPVADILPEETRQRFHIGLDRLELATVGRIADDRRADFAAAFLRMKQAAGLYDREPGKVEFMGRSLFRTTLTLPANVPVGAYRVEVYEVRGGETAATLLDLFIEKTGIEAGVYDFAQHRALAYGLVAVAVALMAGWAASLAFRV